MDWSSQKTIVKHLLFQNQDLIMLVRFLKPLTGYNVKIGSQIHPILIVTDIMEIITIVEMMI